MRDDWGLRGSDFHRSQACPKLCAVPAAGCVLCAYSYYPAVQVRSSSKKPIHHAIPLPLHAVGSILRDAALTRIDRPYATGVHRRTTSTGGGLVVAHTATSRSTCASVGIYRRAGPVTAERRAGTCARRSGRHAAAANATHASVYPSLL
jgi:hypothetical protein